MHRLPLYALLISLAVFSCFCRAESGEITPTLAGSRFSYSVLPGDYLKKIGARFGVSVAVLARDNGIADPDLIMPGQSIWVDNRHIVPEALQTGIVINLPQRMLFYFRDGKLISAYPAGLGRPGWPTVQGVFHVSRLEKNPVWMVPKSIQEEMARESQVVKARVPPGPDNPLGSFWIGLDAPGYGIHGTIAPASVYDFQSHGCIRLHGDDIAQLFPQASKGLVVKIIYTPLLMTDNDGHVFIEANRDIYRRAPYSLATLRRLAAAINMTDRIDWQEAKMIVLRQNGVAEEATFKATK
jgi:L,D-transpeptidase ErfK/SrfK